MIMFPIQMEGFPTADSYLEAIQTAKQTREQIEEIGPLLDEMSRKFAKAILQKERIESAASLSPYVSYREISEYLQSGRPPDSSILLRRQHSFLVTNEGVSTEPLQDYLTKKHDQLIVTETDKTAKRISGKSAYSGVALGNAHIILHKGMFETFKEGEVLVASMTTPDYLPLMKKAAAFVTDEGGVTCHAAIVAREMKKPCVIGTKVATQVLKTGVRVEVDGFKGIVTILDE